MRGSIKVANKEHLKIFRQGVKIWNEWRQEHPNIKPDLSGIEDSHIDIRNAALWSVDLSSAMLSHSLISGSDLSEANLNGVDFSNTNLSNTNLVNAKIQNADLRCTDFIYSNLTGADLSSANLWDANISNANLSKVNLKNADLSHANLNNTNLSMANLTNAELKNTKLRETNFRDADLTNTNFHTASMGKTILGNLDLKLAKGLDSVYHFGPSIIGLETFYKTKNNIPIVFLRGCGVPENFISYMASLIRDPIEFYSCFISYAHEDKAFAIKLHDMLQGRGIRCWMDEHEIKAGDEIYQAVDEGIKLWDKVLLCCSKASLESWWVDNEISTAFSKEQRIMKERGKKVLALIPLNLDNFLFNEECLSTKAHQIKERYAINFIDWESNNAKFKRQFEKLIKALITNDLGKARPPSPKL